jgi:hypothetical protein
MNEYTRRLGTAMILLGLDPRKIIYSLAFFPKYLNDALKFYKSTNKSSEIEFKVRWLPALSDRYMPSGVAKGHYFHQDLWAARHIYKHKPTRHIDVGSRLDGFISSLLVFREVEILDVRNLNTSVRGLHFKQTDLMNTNSENSNSTDSLSCLHALEHFGLGRYGDPINIDGWLTGLKNLANMLSTNGRLYLSVPIGPQVVEFNAQRIFSPSTITRTAESLGLKLIDFSFVDDAGDFQENSQIDKASSCQYGCGCFLFERTG